MVLFTPQDPVNFNNHMKHGTYFQRAYRLGRKSDIAEWYNICFIKMGTRRCAVGEEKRDMKNRVRLDGTVR